MLQVSAGFTYTYNSTLPAGSRVSALALNGTPIDPAATYRLTTNDFLANGGDGFTNLTAGTNRTTAPGFDVDALVGYLGANAPVAPGPAEPHHPTRLSRRWAPALSRCSGWVGRHTPVALAPVRGRGHTCPRDPASAILFYYGTGSPAAVGRA